MSTVAKVCKLEIALQLILYYLDFMLKLLSIKIEKLVKFNNFHLVFYNYRLYIQITVLDSNIEITFSRSIDGNADDWAKGFTGSLYQAVITTNEPFTVGWTFKVRF